MARRRRRHRVHATGARDGGSHHASPDQSGHHRRRRQGGGPHLHRRGDHGGRQTSRGQRARVLRRRNRAERRRLGHHPAQVHPGPRDSIRLVEIPEGLVSFAAKYGPWALVAGASDGGGGAFAEAIAGRGVNVVLLARRQVVLDQVAAEINSRTGAETRAIAVDLAKPGAAEAIAAATADLEIGFLVHCAGADPNFEPFLSNTIQAAEAMVQRNCMVLMQLCHHFAPAMADRGSGGIVIFGSGAGLAGGPNMVAYGASKAFDMVFAEALWAELHDRGVDVLGLILGKTNTPALRQLEHSRGQISSPDELPPGAT